MIQLAVVMTKYIGFQEWQSTGLLDREIRLYQDLDGIETIFYHDEENQVECQGFQFKPKKHLHTDVIDVFKSNQFYGAEEAAEVARSRNLPFIFRCGYSWAEFERKKNISFLRKWSARRREGKLARAVEACVVSNTLDKQLFVDNYKVDKDKIFVHPNWVDVDLFSPDKTIEKKRCVISVGRLEEQKNHRLLIEAVAQLKNIALIIVGEGSLKQELLDQAKDLKVDLTIKAPMSHNNLKELMSQASLFVLPSTYEGLPKVLLETMALAVPALCTSIPEVREVIKEGWNGWYCSFSVQDMAKKIHTALVSDTTDISKNARQTIVDRFGLKKVKHMEVQLIKSLVSK